MFGSGVDVFAVWGYVIANTIDSTVELNPVMLAATLGATPERMEAAIKFLCAPDPRSRNGEKEGRRLIQQGPYQFHVVTHQHYRAIRNEDDRREYNRRKMAESRARKKTVMSNSQSPSIKVNHSEQCVPPCAQAEAEADTEEQKQKPSPKPRKRVSEGPTKTELIDKRHHEIKEAIRLYWKSKNPEFDMPWDQSEATQLSYWMKANPKITLDQVTGFLRNRFRSKVNHGDRPRKWIKDLTSFGPGPVNEFKNTDNGGTNGKGYSIFAELEKSLAADQDGVGHNGGIPGSQA
jgi:hypothetical protein